MNLSRRRCRPAQKGLPCWRGAPRRGRRFCFAPSWKCLPEGSSRPFGELCQTSLSLGKTAGASQKALLVLQVEPLHGFNYLRKLVSGKRSTADTEGTTVVLLYFGRGGTEKNLDVVTFGRKFDESCEKEHETNNLGWKNSQRCLHPLFTARTGDPPTKRQMPRLIRPSWIPPAQPQSVYRTRWGDEGQGRGGSFPPTRLILFSRLLRLSRDNIAHPCIDTQTRIALVHAHTGGETKQNLVI